MNETKISNRAADLRRQAICRLNETEYKEAPASDPRPPCADYELKNDLWQRPSINIQTLILGIAAFFVVIDGSSLYVSEEQRNYLLTATNIKCVSGVTVQRQGGKHPALYFTNAQGQKVASCFKFQCLYKNSHSDVGKAAKICLSGDVVVSIEAEGELKVTRDRTISELDNKIWWSKLKLALGGICLAFFALREWGNWKALIRSRFAAK